MAQALCSHVVPHRKNGLASWVCRFQRLQRSTMEEMVGCVNAQSECVREWGAWKEWRVNPHNDGYFPHKTACTQVDTWLSWELIPLHLEFVPLPKGT
jgi:hypothetical protein